MHADVRVVHYLINQLIDVLTVLIDSFCELRLTLMYVLLIALSVSNHCLLIQNFILEVYLRSEGLCLQSSLGLSLGFLPVSCTSSFILWLLLLGGRLHVAI